MDFQDLKMDSEHLDIASEYQTSNLKVRGYPNSKGLLMKKSQKVSAPHNLELQSTQSPSPVTQSPSPCTQSPSLGTQSQSLGTQSPSLGTKGPSVGTQSPSPGTKCPLSIYRYLENIPRYPESISKCIRTYRVPGDGFYIRTWRCILYTWGLILYTIYPTRNGF